MAKQKSGSPASSLPSEGALPSTPNAASAFGLPSGWLDRDPLGDSISGTALKEEAPPAASETTEEALPEDNAPASVTSTEAEKPKEEAPAVVPPATATPATTATPTPAVVPPAAATPATPATPTPAVVPVVPEKPAKPAEAAAPTAKEPTPEEIAEVHKKDAEWIGNTAKVLDVGISNDQLETVLNGGPEGLAALKSMLQTVAATSMLHARKMLHADFIPTYRELADRVRPIVEERQKAEEDRAWETFNKSNPDLAPFRDVVEAFAKVMVERGGFTPDETVESFQAKVAGEARRYIQRYTAAAAPAPAASAAPAAATPATPAVAAPVAAPAPTKVAPSKPVVRPPVGTLPSPTASSPKAGRSKVSELLP